MHTKEVLRFVYRLESNSVMFVPNVTPSCRKDKGISILLQIFRIFILKSNSDVLPCLFSLKNRNKRKKKN